jgi:hypothetical protein
MSLFSSVPLVFTRVVLYIYERITEARMETPQSLTDDLYDNVVDSTFPDASSTYWPENVVDELIQDGVVRRELDEAKGKYSDTLVEFILHHAKKLFAIAALADSNRDKLLKAMKFFQEKGFQDSKLSTEIASHGVGSQQQSRSCLSKEKLVHLDPKLWKSSIVNRICEVQWQVLVPVFSTTKTNYDFEGKTILPFTKVDIDRGDLGGAFSRVYKVKIHSGHFVDPTWDVSFISLLRRSCWQDDWSFVPNLHAVEAQVARVFRCERDRAT